MGNGRTFQKGFDPRRKILSEIDRIKAVNAKRNKRLELYSSLSFNELPLNEKRRIVLKEQDNKCLCGINKWLEKDLVLELDHIDGNKKNNDRDNLRILCPNCHSQTPTFRNRRRI